MAIQALANKHKERLRLALFMMFHRVIKSLTFETGMTTRHTGTSVLAHC